MATETQMPTDDSKTAPPPSPPSPPTSPPLSSSNGNTRPAPVDGRQYYGYLFRKDKTPTNLLDALLRAIGRYIALEIGDKNHAILDKPKLAAFYKAVGGDYDSLFVAAPDKSVSYIWQALGVQHTLQPVEDDFAEPSVPALTLKGFVRWESLQILLGPEEHVPFIQFAVRNWGLRHPDTGEPFPVDLPKEAFPTVCDPQIDAWHRDCAKRLRSEAAPHMEKTPPAASHDPRVHFTHVRPSGPSRQGPAMDYFEQKRTNLPYAHIPSRHAAPVPHHSQSPHKHRRGSISSDSSHDDSARRRKSFSDYASPLKENKRPPTHIDTRRPAPPVRRPSQPKHHSTSETDSDSDTPVSPRTRSHRSERPPSASVRVFPPDSPVSPAAAQIPARSYHRTDPRQDDPRRRSHPSGTFGIRQKLSSFLPGSTDRTRSNSGTRNDRESNSAPNSARLHPEHPSSRLSRRWSEEDFSSGTSDSDMPRRHDSRRHYDRERLRDREYRAQRDRELEDERERRSRKDRAYLRPAVTRRTSSAADVERGPRQWDGRERRRDRDRDVDRDGDPRDPRKNLTGDERERRGRRARERGESPVVVGVSGRKYPTEGLKPAWT